jgi:hypothetical protein
LLPLGDTMLLLGYKAWVNKLVCGQEFSSRHLELRYNEFMVFNLSVLRRKRSVNTALNVGIAS